MARSHPGGIVDLSVGTPVDPTPAVVQSALAGAADAHGYPLTAGKPDWHLMVGMWAKKHLKARAGTAYLPTIGSKELVAWLPTLLEAKTVLFPAVSYPTYEVGALIAGAKAIRVGSDVSKWPDADLVWLNSPSNPTGEVWSSEQMKVAVDWAQEHDAVVASDECYFEFGWDAQPVSVLEVAGAEARGVLAVHSLSKRSNMAGYRAGFVAGDSYLINGLLELRKHAGMIVPEPVQRAMIAALGDETHVQDQRARYQARREVLRKALEAAGFSISHSQAGLYLWATRDELAWKTVEWLAHRGILVAPGTFYEAGHSRHVRFALTATDERISAAVERLS